MSERTVVSDADVIRMVRQLADAEAQLAAERALREKLVATCDAISACTVCAEDYGRCMKCDRRLVEALTLARQTQEKE